MAVDKLDAKPTPTPTLDRIKANHGQIAMLQHAADHGHAFDRLECRDCYGPGYNSI